MGWGEGLRGKYIDNKDNFILEGALIKCEH